MQRRSAIRPYCRNVRPAESVTKGSLPTFAAASTKVGSGPEAAVYISQGDGK
jgi:hypothetical protein